MVALNLNLAGANGNLSEFGKVPAGIYAFTVAGAEMKEAKSGNYYMALKLKVAQGEFAGKCIGDNLNIYHPEIKVAGYACDTLKKIMTQIGHANPEILGDTDELLNGGTFHAEVKIEPYVNADGENKESSKLGFLVTKDTPLKDGILEAQAAKEAAPAATTTANPFANKTETPPPAAPPVASNEGKSIGAADLNAATGGTPPPSAPAADNTPPWLKK